MWARISVLILYMRIRNVRVRIRIESCVWGQGLEDWALLMVLEIQIIMYSSTQGSTFGILRGFCDRADTSKNVHIVLPGGIIEYCVMSVL